MKEDFLHYVWRFQKFNISKLKTSCGASVEILSFGSWNHDAGPDFLSAKIKINDKIWAGHVEIHVRASEWLLHKHQFDPKYKQTILHVVYEEDKQIINNGKALPCLVLKNRINAKTLRQYFNLKSNPQFIPCENLLQKVNAKEKNTWIKQLGVRRIEQKAANYLKISVTEMIDWETLFFQQTAYYFGASKNKDQMLQMAKQIPLKLVRKHSDQNLILEALFFGQSGLLNREFSDAYPCRLRSEYSFLKQKYKLTPVKPQIWNFFRLRPANFPTIRIAQLSSLYSDFSNPFQQLINCTSVPELFDLLCIVPTEYWDAHFLFDKESSFRVKQLGKERVQLLILNVLIPLMLAFARKNGNKEIEKKAKDWLQELHPEKNKWIDKFAALGFEAYSALDSQGILELHNQYCLKRKCLQCSIGNIILNDQLKK